MLEFRILGPLEVEGELGTIQLGGARQRAALAILLLNANRVVSVDTFAEDLYAGTPPVSAVTQVQRQISDLRRLLGAEAAIETRSPGYVIRLSPEQLDLHRFEQLTGDASRARSRELWPEAEELLREALALWRGAPLADLAREPFAQPAISRLLEIRLAALEQRLDVDLALGRERELVAELEQLVAENPLRERFRAQLMLALYRSSRQADALAVYRDTREALVETLGIEPTAVLRELERAILAQDPSLDRKPAATVESSRALLVLPSGDDPLDALLPVAAPLAGRPGRELIVARLLDDERDVAPAAAALDRRRTSLEVPARTAAFTTHSAVEDAARLATTYDVELVLVDAPPNFDGEMLPDDLAEILEGGLADVAVLAGEPAELGEGALVFVPFGGGEHDWAAVELAALLVSATRTRLVLAGTKADTHHGRRDASRLLADAGLAVQRVVGVVAEPLLLEPTEEALVAAASSAALVVVGISPRWRRDGIGATRRALVRGSRTPIVLVHRGPRPSGLAPDGTRTRFTWSLEA
jgi:DNA-binding SARP family transcriptional activator